MNSDNHNTLPSPSPVRLTQLALEDIRAALDVLHKGGVILYPTDTIWGLGCDATNPDAVRRIYEIKKRSDSKALIALVDSEAKVQYYVPQIPDVAWDVVEMSTRPTTIIYDNARNLAPNLLADDGSVGIRITREAFSRQLCLQFKKAIVSTSANISGEAPPSCFNDTSDAIRSQVDYIVRYRQDETAKAQASSIIKIGAHAEVKVIR